MNQQEAMGKDKALEQVREISGKLQEPLVNKLKELEREQLGESFEELSAAEEMDKVFKLRNQIEPDEEYQKLNSLGEKLEKAMKLLNTGIGPAEPDEGFVQEPEKVEDGEAVQELSDTLSGVNAEKVAGLDEKEVEKLEEALKEFFSHAD